MNYYLIPNKETSCQMDFPAELSFFFEQYGGYEEFSDVAQIEKILNIDLSIYQKTFLNEIAFHELEEFGEIDNAKEEFAKHKNDSMIPLQLITEKTKKLVELINEFPSFYQQIKHKSENDPESNFFPSDSTGYYESGRFENDLKELIKVYTCLHIEGVTHVWLEYT